MNKRIQSFLIFSLILFPFHGIYAEEKTTLGSPLFITNPFRDPPKAIQPRTQKKFIKKPFQVLDNYLTVASGSAITLYKHNNSELYIEKVDLSKGAYLKSLGQATEWDGTTGEPLFPKMNISDTLESLADTPFSLINGQFFDPKRNPTPLSFGLKVDGEVKTAGADNRNEKKNILTFSGDIAQIIPYSWENLRDTKGYLSFVNFSVEQKHHRYEEIGRTYICLAHPDRSNRSSELIIMVAKSINEIFAEKELLRFGCTRESISKLDSSGSSRLWYRDGTIYGNAHHGDPDARKIPNMIGIWDKKDTHNLAFVR
ncbi:hypothetical protein KBB25_01550 [Candidatus Gracilibacteria bacterium]|nr:hypothetical protein [Candidatus Gracilibacteria bacterium]